MLSRVAAGDPRYRLYADKIFTSSLLVRAAYSRRNGPLTPWMRSHNHIMSRIRVAVEWAFGKIVTRAKHIAFAMSMKLREIPVVKYFVVATLFANAHTCVYGCQQTPYFGVLPPSLFDYFDQ